MNRLNLRPHHLMCSYTFTGVGYSKEFTENMTNIVAKLYAAEPPEICLLSHCDDLCNACPHNQNGICDTEEAVKKRDEEVSAFFGLQETKRLTENELRTVLEKQKGLHSIREICRECTFTELCEEVLKRKNKAI